MLNRFYTALILVALFSHAQVGHAQILGIPLYTWDFSTGLPSGWTSSNGNGNNLGVWEYRGPNTTPNISITSRGSCSGGNQQFTSITQSNGFMIFDSNYWDDPGTVCGAGFGTGPAPAPHNAWLITNSFALTGVTGAAVTFQQQFRNNAAILKVQYSINNGTTWIDMLTQQNVFPTAAAEWKTASFPSGAIGQTNVKLRFLFTGSYYSWCIDDITVYKPSINDLSISNTRYTTFGNTTPTPPNDFHDLPYDMYPIPMATVVPFKFSAKANNIGSAQQTGVNLNVKVLNNTNTILFNQTTSNSTVASGATPTLTITPTYTPPSTAGYYRVVYQINQTQTDEIPNNNRDTLDFKMHPFQYARDEGAVEDVFTPSAFYAGQPYEVGNIFQARTTSLQCNSIVVAVGPGTTAGTVIQGKIFKNSFAQEVAQTVTYTVNAWDINNIGQEKLITLNLPTPLALQQDSLYFVMVGNTLGTMPLRIGRAGTAIPETSLVRYPQNNGLAYMAKMPIVRMNLFTPSQIPGCTNPIAINYLPTATTDDASCDIPGCTNQSSSNYNAAATWDNGTCVVLGCTNPLATNYNPLATVNDGSCIIPGCTDPNADNYNSSATVSNGTCIYYGCTNPQAANYDPMANQNDGSCIFPGCTDPLASNFNPQANQNNGSCIYPGCTDPIAANYNPQANQNNGSCIYPGCTDPYASNYNAQANLNNGSCIYPGCTDPNASNYNAQANQNNGTCIYPGCTDPTAANYNPQANQNNGTCIYPGCTNPEADNYNPQANQNNGTCIFSGCTNPIAINFDPQANLNNGSCIIVGCTNPLAENYNPIANQENGTCIILGCTDLAASNYNPSANTNNNTCLYPGCTLAIADNYNPNANLNDGSCIISGCTDPEADNYFLQANLDDGSCEFSGCTASNASNFSPQANVDDGSCIFLGCTDPEANNFDPIANSNDFSCEYNTPTIEIQNSEICQNATATIFNQTIYNADNSCLIDFGDGTEENGCFQNYTHTYTEPGAYLITLYFSQGDTTLTTTSTIVVHPNPDTPIVLNNQLLSVSNTQADLNYTWFLNGLQTSIQNDTLNYFILNETLNANGNYFVQSTNSFGCRSNSDITFVVIPDMQLSSTGGCIPYQIDFTNTTGIAENVTCYLQFNADEGFIPFENTASFIFETAGSFSPAMYCVSNGQAYYTTEEWLIETYNPPSNPILTSQNNLVTITNPQNCNITWLLDGVILNTNNNPTSISTYFNNAYQNGVYSAILTNQFGCSSSAGSISILQSAISVTNNQGCAPLTVQFTNTTDFVENTTCELSINNNTYSIDFGETLPIVLNNSGTYSGVLTCQQGNLYSQVISNDAIVFSNPASPILTSDFGIVSTTNSQGNSVIWSLDNVNLNFNSPSISTFINGIYQSGTYAAYYTNSFGCISQTTALNVIQPTLSFDQNAICPGESITFTNTTDPLPNTFCVLTPYNGAPNYSLNPYESITIPYDFAGAINVTLSCTSGNVQESNSYPLQVNNAPPVPQLFVNSNQVTAYNILENDSLTWFYNGIAILGSNPLNTLQSGAYSAQISNEFGCISNSNAVFILHPTFTSNTNTGCPNESITFTNTTPTFENMTCTLLPGDGNSYNFNEPIDIMYETSNVYTPVIECIISGETFSATGEPIEIYPNPATPILQTQYGAIICSNCNNQPTSYYMNGQWLGTSSFNFSTYSNGQYLNGYFTAQTENTFGCVSNVSDSVLLIHPILTSNIQIGCIPMAVNFNNNTENIAGLNCILNVSDQLGDILLPPTGTYNYTYNAANNYNAFLTCELAGLFFESPNLVIETYGGTQPDLVQDGDTISCLNCLIESNTSWLIDGTLNLSGTVSVDTLYGTFFSATYINEYGCSAENFIQVIQVEEADDYRNSNLVFYPNPANSEISILNQAGNTIEIFTLTGKSLGTYFINSDLYSIDTSALAEGTYLLFLKTKDSNEVGTFLVMH